MEKTKAQRLKENKEKIIINLMIQKHQSLENKAPINGLAVDASCNGKGVGEIRGVDLETGEIIFNEIIPGKSTPNTIEYLAIYNGLKWCLENKRKPLIYSDSLVAIGWVKNKKCNTLHPVDEQRLMILKANRLFNENKGIFYWWNNKKWGETPADFGRKRKRHI